MTLENYEDYFIDIATHHKLIAHQDANYERTFKRDSIDVLISCMRGDLAVDKRFALILENPDGTLSDGGSDNPRDNQRGAFWIIKNIAKGDIIADKAVRTQAKSICISVISKIRNDHRKGIKTPFLKALDINNIEYHPVGPVMDNCVGYRCEFGFNEFIDLSFKPSDWTY